MEPAGERKPVGAVLVVGAGIAGIQASLDLADSGYRVYLLESSPAIGGAMAQLDKTFPTNDCSMCILSPKVVECARHLNIEVMTWAELDRVQGEAGDFTVRVRHKARYVSPEKCTACNECTRVCPVDVPSEFDEGRGTRKAIFRPYPQAAPNVFLIDKRGTAPCKAACPAGTSAQGYVALIAKGRYAEALALSRQANPFTAVCGRVCYHPCETACSRSLLDEQPVAIAGLKRFMSDWAAEHGDVPVAAVPVTRTQRVAIVGGGPAGLTAARDLATLGYGVTVYESRPKLGGMLRYGIPDYRLPPNALDQDIQRILDLGVEARVNTRIGDLDALRAEYGAVLLAIGAHRSTSLRVMGEDLPGVHSAADFLARVNGAGDPAVGELPQVGKRVVVVGGGNTAMDAARCARRLGAEVTLVYRRSRAEMPAYAFEVQEAEDEGVALSLLTNPVRILGQDRVSGIELVKMELGEPDDSGRRRPVAVEGSNYVVEADAVILAIGQTSDVSGLPKALDVTRWGSLAYDEESLATSLPGVFTAGDAATGPRSAIEAVGMGHRAAESIHQHLSGESVTLLPRFDPARVVELDRVEVAEQLSAGRAVRRDRAQPGELAPAVRTLSFDEAVHVLTEEQAVAEAERCLQCGICSECYRCVDACKPEAIDHSAFAEDTYEELNVGAIILATGFDEFDAGRIHELGYGRLPDVVTSIEFERLLSASGPYAGHVVRPSDGVAPQRIAFLQCVGSRDQQCDNAYCSSVCCMYAIKEAVIAKEHMRAVEPTIFYMDMRAYGKDFDKYYERARDEYGVRFVRSRVSTVSQAPDGTLDVEYVTLDDRLVHEAFDMVVLSVGLEPSKGTVQLADKLGLRHGEGRFVYTDEFSPLSTSRAGIYTAGAASGPKDIPETVMQASGAAAEAAELLAPARGMLVRTKEYPAEIDISGDPPRVGVFVCHCGTNIAGVVDVEKVCEYARTLPYVVHAERNLFTCSPDTQEAMKETIRRYGINRVVVSSCSPRTHEALFQETIHEVGLNPYLFELANIRDQCSWVHMTMPAEATDKSMDLVRMAVSRVVNNQPLYGQPQPVTHSALVIGGGVAGLSAALKLAGQGYPVHLVEREAELGGNARHVHSTLRNPHVQDILDEIVARVASHPLITVHTRTMVKQVGGFVGNFESVLEHAANGSVASEVTVKHGVIIVATGAKECTTSQYYYGQDERVVTQRQLEESLAAGGCNLPANGTVVMIQCVESRTPEHPYCSRVCCTQAVKNAIALKERDASLNVVVLYRDIRTYGTRELAYQRARDLGVVFIPYDIVERVEVANAPLSNRALHGVSSVSARLERPPVVERRAGRLIVSAWDPVSQSELTLEPDLLALSVGIKPRDDSQALAAMLKVSTNADRFYLEAHMKLRPVDFATEGIYVAGMAHGPKFIDESIAQASAAVARACTVLAQDELVSSGLISRVDPQKCVGCGDCVRICPYQAVTMVNKEVMRRVFRDCAEINPALCKGCGACTAGCRSGAITLDGFDDVEIMAQISALWSS